MFSVRKLLYASIGALLLAAGCARVPVPTFSDHLGRDDPLGECAEFFRALDVRVEQAGVTQAHPFRVTGYPYLRVDRFLASFAGEKKSPAVFEDWVDRMQALDIRARTHEIANLIARNGTDSDDSQGAEAYLDRAMTCGDLLKNADDALLRERLPAAAKSPDDYIDFRRAAGLYPLTRLFISAGVSSWHAEERSVFSATPPRQWHGRRYMPLPGESSQFAEQILSAARSDSLGVPEFSTAALEALFRIFAPSLEIQQGGPADRIGRPHWGTAGRLAVDTNEPIAYTFLSFTRFENRVLAQLNYFFWLPERPRQHPLDIFAGLLDGLIYRVTLDIDGAPLLYETVHSCGCYYKAYPSKRLTTAAKMPYTEPPLILTAPEYRPGREVMTISLTSRAHYVRHLYPIARIPITTGEHYRLTEYSQLYALALPGGGSRSMFGRDGLAPGTERLERFILWPTGVLSPGAMRQWGRHAVAFAGKRHFDDPFYMEKMFRRR